MSTVTFKTLTPENYARLPLDARVDYLPRPIDDISQQTADARRQLEEAQKRLTAR